MSIALRTARCLNGGVGLAAVGCYWYLSIADAERQMLLRRELTQGKVR